MRELDKALKELRLYGMSGAFDVDVLAALKASGKGWQTRVSDATREWVKSHSAV